tara:strand:+ start:2132 stop:2290 length:159 start_codon:yes stop_codon:yes gene_type:complete
VFGNATCTAENEQYQTFKDAAMPAVSVRTFVYLGFFHFACNGEKTKIENYLQ